MQRLLAEGEITAEKVAELFQGAQLKAEIDSDGDVAIQEGGMKTFVRVDRSKKWITYFRVCRFRPTATELEKLRFVNRLNDNLIFVRFVVAKGVLLWAITK